MTGLDELRERITDDRNRRDRAPWMREPWWAEVGSGFAALMWSLLAALGHYRLADLETMRFVLGIADQAVWQIGGFFLGIAQVIIVFLDNTWLRWGMTAIMTTWWALLTITIWIALATPSLGLYLTMTLLNLIATMRLLKRTT